MNNKINEVKRIIKHKKAFLKIERKLVGRNTTRGYLHDMDKICLVLFSNKTKKEIQHIHRSNRKHHDNSLVKTRNDYIEMIIDWECARFTKPDKPLNAYQTLHKYYPHLKNEIEPILWELHLLKHKK